ncbi:purine-nucleoside phosphorylase [Motiliproteus sp. MSK22-1]|nr:purine-nucleoside phosphorylase [Motiliproteus sp. MSK22-1]
MIQSEIADSSADIQAPKVAIILGSGLGPFADALETVAEISYSELPGFPEPGVGGHAGRLLLAKSVKGENMDGATFVVLQGRAHYYEKGEADVMAVPIHTLAAIGCETLVLTNAAGSLLTEAGPGAVMLITDHINMTGVSPLFGETGNQRFVNMGDAYEPFLNQQFLSIAEKQNIELHQGVYAWMSGPQFETNAEIRALRTLGSDAVGMSTVPEVILAKHQGMKVAALSIITNYAAGMSETPLSHEQTIDKAALATKSVKTLLTHFLKEYQA